LRHATTILLWVVLTAQVYGHGYTVSTLAEAHKRSDFIGVVLVLDVQKPHEQEYSARNPVAMRFKLIETLKGATQVKTKAIFRLPPIERDMGDGKVMREWLKIPASGSETSVTKGTECIIYAQKHALAQDGDTIRILRIDPISEKPKLVELLKAGKQGSQPAAAP